MNYQSLEVLQEHGIAANDIQKLQNAGFYTVESVRCEYLFLANPRTCCQLTLPQIAHATVRKLSDVKGISEAKVMKLKEVVKAMVPMDFRTAADALEDRK